MSETNNLIDVGINHHDTHQDITLGWDDPQLKAITRIRFIADSWAGPFDLSYCLGRDIEGRQVRVRIPTYQVMGSGATVTRSLVEAAKRDGVYLRGLCGGDIRSVVSLCW
jgi:hypothetical protein